MDLRQYDTMSKLCLALVHLTERSTLQRRHVFELYREGVIDLRTMADKLGEIVQAYVQDEQEIMRKINRVKYGRTM